MYLSVCVCVCVCVHACVCLRVCVNQQQNFWIEFSLSHSVSEVSNHWQSNVDVAKFRLTFTCFLLKLQFTVCSVWQKS